MAIRYEEFDIVEVAKMCGVQFHAYDHNEIEYKALCPFCGDTSYHLGLNRKMDRFHCFMCKTRGNSVSLYAKMFGLTNKQAYDIIRNNDKLLDEKVFTYRENPETPIRPIEDRHNVYYDFLSLLRLNRSHRENLEARGLSFNHIHQFMYRSIIDPEAAEVVRRIFNMRDNGMSYTEIAKQLNSEEIPSPSEYKLKFKKKRDWRRVGQAAIWNRSMICRILDDERYIGNMVSGMTRVKHVGGNSSKTNPEDYVIVENTHEPIIEREQFLRVRPKKLSEPRSQKREKVLLDGLLRCPGCNRVFGKYGSYPRSVKFRCYSLWVGVENDNCTHETFNEQELNDIVVQAVKLELAKTAELLQVREGMKDKEKAYGKRINAINKKIAGLKQQKIDEYIKLTKNELSEEGFLELKQKIECSIQECERELDSFKIEGLSAADEVAMNLFEEFLDAETFTNKMLKCLINTIYVYDDRRIEIKWNFKEKVA